MMDKQMVSLVEYVSEVEARVASAHLEAAGVHARVVKDDAGGMLPSLQETEGVTLLVRPRDMKRARAVLAEKRRLKKS